MNKIGLIGGMSYESTLIYYKEINKMVNQKLGGLASAKIILESVNFAEVEAFQHQGKWPELTEMMISLAKNLEDGGAQCLGICTNTMHMMADKIQENIQIPIIHIGDSVAKKVLSFGEKKAVILGTKFTMEGDFYEKRLEANGVTLIRPKAKQREIIHEIIYSELCKGIIKQSSKDKYIDIINELSEQSSIFILGCTEIPLLVNSKDFPDNNILLVDSTLSHCESLVDFAAL